MLQGLSLRLGYDPPYKGGGDQQGNVVTIDFANQGYANAQEFPGLTVGDVSISGDKGTNSNSPKYYTTGNAIRVYGDNTLTVKSSSKAITKVEFTFSSGDGTNSITADTGTWAEPVWTGSSASVTSSIICSASLSIIGIVSIIKYLRKKEWQILTIIAAFSGALSFGYMSIRDQIGGPSFYPIDIALMLIPIWSIAIIYRLLYEIKHNG